MSDPKSQTTDWQPIETAPKDGTCILLLFDWEPLCVVAYWGPSTDSDICHWRVRWDEEMLEPGFDSPSDWMPIAALPNGETLPPHPRSAESHG